MGCGGRTLVGAVGDAIGSVLGGILDFFPHSPAKKGPLSAVGWRQLKTSGAATMAQFIDGAEGQASTFGDALAAAAGSASTRVQASIGTASPGLATSSTAQAAGLPQTVILVDADGSILARTRVVAEDVTADVVGKTFQGRPR